MSYLFLYENLPHWCQEHKGDKSNNDQSDDIQKRILTSSLATGIPVPLQQDISMKLNLRLDHRI